MQGDLIRETRKKKGLSQAKLARLLGIRQALLSSWELNKSEPSPEISRKIFDLIRTLDKETIIKLRKRCTKKGGSIQNQMIASSKACRERPALTEAERKKRLPFLYFDLNRIPYNGRKGIALFSGIGGMSLGFRFAGFQILGYVEIHEPFRRIFEANFPDSKCLGRDIQNVSNEDVLSWRKQYGEVECLFGGPPCQGFSLAGKRDRFDERNQLYKEFARVASLLKPKTIVMENVSLMTSMKNPEGRLMPEVMIEAFENAVYNCRFEILRAEDYGVPQRRRRLFMIGVRKDLGVDQITFPPPTHRPPGQKTLLGHGMEPYVTFWEAAGDLESLKAGQYSSNDVWHKATPHPDYVVKMLEGIPEGMSAHDNPDPSLRPTSGYNTTYKRIRWDEPCSTISTNFNMISGCRHVHPSDTRAFTVREAMRAQTFPESFKISGKIEDIRKGIGNAVPPLLAMKIADHIHKLILSQAFENYTQTY
jgi:DNA (cytosine-5)-methyltransferase 1